MSRCLVVPRPLQQPQQSTTAAAYVPVTVSSLIHTTAVLAVVLATTHLIVSQRG